MIFYLNIVLFFLTINYSGQKEAIDKKNSLSNTIDKPIAALQKFNLNDGFRLEDALPKGYVKDGTVDYTNYIQNVLNRNNNIIFPAFPLLINDSGLRIKSNSILKFPKGSEIRLLPSSKAHYAIFLIESSSQISLINPVLIGDGNKHLGKSGEWGMGIKITNSSNISIYNAKISNCWGDGIYINGIKRNPSKNIKIMSSSCVSNRRNGISIISVDSLLIQDTYTANNNGTPPMCGIDIEPNSYMDEVKNVKIVNARTESNLGKGISLSLEKLYGSVDKNISIYLKNHKDFGSSKGLHIACNNKKSLIGEKVSGNITILNPSFRNNKTSSFDLRQLREPNLNLVIGNPFIINTEGITLSKASIDKLLKTNLGSNMNYNLN
ncbi:right-handed parallel beta-helix repeat-containing protein [Rubrolithibacter danxiaensis]|uniref:right-handed parallel beta-helix repeat-containing protein n=1 Tax=Rubrolithibacter danxiaensis TaxID=3390805 RepID=UPI003BF7ABA0